MVRGVSRIWWQIDPLFNDPGPYVFQLQYGRTGLRDTPDRTDIGLPVVDNWLQRFRPGIWHEGGVTAFWPITGSELTTPNNVDVSQAANCFGEPTERDWLLSREIIRKEELRHRLVSVSGYLYEAISVRQAPVLPLPGDQLTKEVTDSNCPVCSGTGYESRLSPLRRAMQCWELSPEIIAEHVDSQVKGSTRENAYVTARVIGFPALKTKTDIWVNASSDERGRNLKLIQVIAVSFGGVPIVYNVEMGPAAA
jgi:hypothetical protein